MLNHITIYFPVSLLIILWRSFYKYAKRSTEYRKIITNPWLAHGWPTLTKIGLNGGSSFLFITSGQQICLKNGCLLIASPSSGPEPSRWLTCLCKISKLKFRMSMIHNAHSAANKPRLDFQHASTCCSRRYCWLLQPTNGIEGKGWPERISWRCSANGNPIPPKAWIFHAVEQSFKILAMGK